MNAISESVVSEIKSKDESGYTSYDYVTVRNNLIQDRLDAMEQSDQFSEEEIIKLRKAAKATMIEVTRNNCENNEDCNILLPAAPEVNMDVTDNDHSSSEDLNVDQNESDLLAGNTEAHVMCKDLANYVDDAHLCSSDSSARNAEPILSTPDYRKKRTSDDIRLMKQYNLGVHNHNVLDGV